MKDIKKVHVIFKTHLDVGFTDLAKNVTNKYINNFIPKAIMLAKKVNKDKENKIFIWTVGSWIIDEYLRTVTGKAKDEIIDAINQGYISWHGLPFTTHSELMDVDLFNFGIGISKELDKRFSRNTIAAKMTDVPGHTRGIIEPLCINGIKYLHIGVNDVSHKPKVYDTIIWRDSKGNEIIVDYCQGYGKTTIVPGFDEVLFFAHSGDNLGPPCEDDVYRQMENIQKQFPSSQVKASSLDDYARALMNIKEKLPIITEEIGDTWIHGIASDPYKVSSFFEMLRLKDKWVKDGKLEKGSIVYNEFLRNLLMIPEHTWGLDFKKYMSEYKNWRKQDFIKARIIDKISDEYCMGKYAEFAHYLKEEFESQIKHMNWDQRSYSYYESSHSEQRSYVTCAIETLPPDLKEEANKAILVLKQCPEKSEGYREISLNEKTSIDGFLITVLLNGSISLEGNNIESTIILGKVTYEIFGIDTFKKWKKEYMVDLEANKLWGTPDFFKPGIEEAGAPQRNVHFYCKVQKCFQKENELIIEARFEDYECNEYGCPRNVAIKYVFNKNEIEICAYLSQKDASRMPEALWISHFTANDKVENVKLKKLGEIIDPLKVVECGNRNYHCVKEVNFTLDGLDINIVPLDSTLLSLGEMRLYDFNQNYADPKKGFHFNLYNNLWGTNFKMWYEEDIISRFKIVINRV